MSVLDRPMSNPTEPTWDDLMKLAPTVPLLHAVGKMEAMTGDKEAALVAGLLMAAEALDKSLAAHRELLANGPAPVVIVQDEAGIERLRLECKGKP